MARIRTIKPEFFTSEDIVSLTPLARVFYIALWCEADREGRLDWKPGTLKMRYLPGDNCDFQALANELISAGLVVLYDVDGKTYAEIPTFKTHQVINNRETESTRPARVKAEGKEGRKGKGKEGKDDASRDALFDTFWKAYPRKVGKDEARKAFDKRKPTPELLNAILAAIEVQRQTLDWQKDGGQFIPHPATWLNQGRWQDEIGGDEPQGNPMFAGAI